MKSMSGKERMYDFLMLYEGYHKSKKKVQTGNNRGENVCISKVHKTRIIYR